MPSLILQSEGSLLHFAVRSVSNGSALTRQRPLLAILAVSLFIAVRAYGVSLGENIHRDSRDVPLWAKQVIWYQIFPERFRNGDKGNDPKLSDLEGSWPHNNSPQWNISPWTSDWYQLQDWEKLDDKGFYYHVQRRRYGGDLQGVLDKLDYLAELGVTALYLNPIFESPSLHKYDATMYHHVDNNFGPDPDGDRKVWTTEDPGDPRTWKWTSADRLFLRLLSEAHKRGMKVIIDGVFNHVGMTFWAFQDVREKGEKSLYKDWFTIKRWDDPSTPGDEFEYQGWFGVPELPEMREDERGLVKGPRDHIRAIVRRWMDPNGDGDPEDGVDGWRLDVADMVAMPFWREFRSWVREINPQAYTVGEVWWEDWKNNKMFNAEPWLNGDCFDAVMNYRWAREVCHFFIDQENKITASEFDRRLKQLRNDYREDVNYVLMNLLDSHDTDRFASHIVNIDSYYDKNVGVNDNRSYDVRKPNVQEVQNQKLIALFQMTYVGAPALYYGTEAGMWGADDPDDRKPMVWEEYTFKDERSHPFGSERLPDRNNFNRDLFEYYKKLITIRASHKSLSLGSYSTILLDDTKDLYVFLRSFEGENVLVALNNSGTQQIVHIPVESKFLNHPWVDLIDGMIAANEANEIVIKLDSKKGAVLLAQIQ